MNKLFWIQIAIVMFLALPAFSQDVSTDSTMAAVDTLQQDFGLFTNADVLHLALRFDLREYTRKKPKEEYMDAILTYYINGTDSINKKIKLKSRGVSRNDICSFPPIRLNFSKNDFKKEDLKKVDKIKLVTHCMSGNEENLFKEYLIYKLYNILTDYSFRVRLAMIDYISTAPKGKTFRSYGFMIEPLEFLAERTKSVPVETVALNQKNIIPDLMDRMAIFNYMIGNTDWSVPGQHNCKVLSGSNFDNPGLGLIVPYDFDYSGLVDAHYAVPAEGTGLERVTQRRYQGLCRTDEEYNKALKEFIDKKQDFYRTINEFPQLGEKTKKMMIRFLDEFFISIEKGNVILNNFRNECRES